MFTSMPWTGVLSGAHTVPKIRAESFGLGLGLGLSPPLSGEETTRSRTRQAALHTHAMDERGRALRIVAVLGLFLIFVVFVLFLFFDRLQFDWINGCDFEVHAA